MAVLGASSLQIDSATLGSQSGSAPMFAARAWVNWNGSTNGIRSSGNISSITKNSTGNYTLNFSTAQTDANYASVATLRSADNTTLNTGNRLLVSFITYATSSVTVITHEAANNVFQDPTFISASIFR